MHNSHAALARCQHSTHMLRWLQTLTKNRNEISPDVSCHTSTCRPLACTHNLRQPTATPCRMLKQEGTFLQISSSAHADFSPTHHNGTNARMKYYLYAWYQLAGQLHCALMVAPTGWVQGSNRRDRRAHPRHTKEEITARMHCLQQCHRSAAPRYQHQQTHPVRGMVHTTELQHAMH